jgi:hypothetical protein
MQNKSTPQSAFFDPRALLCRAACSILAGTLLAFFPSEAPAKDNNRLVVNKYGAPVIDAKGRRITYDRKTLEAMVNKAGVTERVNASATAQRASRAVNPRQFVPAGGQTQQPFWQYGIFGSGIGASNIVIGPMPPSGGPEIIIGGNSRNDFGDDDFWQVIRYNPMTTTYDPIFVSRLYCEEDDCSLYHSNIMRIGLAHVTSASEQQVVVMLDDGRIYLYDFATKTELGHLDTGISGLQGLSLTDLNGDGLAELIVTTSNDLFVFNGSGQLLWQVPGAGGYDVVAGQMDNDAAIEIAATNGKVVDAATHAIQWTHSGGFGVHLKLAPFPGENYQQLISATGWQFVYSYDVGRQLPRWSIQTPQDIGAIEVADVDNDGIPEVIIGDGQWGTVHVHDLITQALKWSVNNPDHGVTNIAVGDVDHDGVVELLWGAGWTDTGPDHLYVANTTGGHNVEWQNINWWGPFAGPAIGDLDGDGQPELVICSQGSELLDSPRILVFDLATLALRAISPPIIDNGFSVYGVGDLKLRDVQGNGRKQIVIGTDSVYDGVIVVYRFDSNNTFTRIWTNATRPDGAPFRFVDVADLDNNGVLKVLGGNYDASGNGVYMYAYDYPSGTQSWQSVNLASNYNAVAGLVVEDLDGNGSKEIAALVSTGDLYTWDGPTRQLRNLRQGTNGTLLSDRATPAGLVLGDTSGIGHFLQWSNNSYTETFTRQLSTQCDPYLNCFNGINVASDDSLWTGVGGTLYQRLAPSYNSVAWQSPAIGDGFGRFTATGVRGGQNCVFSSARQAAVGLTYGPAGTPSPTPTPTATPTATPIATATATPTATATSTPTATATATATATPTPTPTPTPTATPAPTPVVTTNAATNVASVSATLNGSVNPRGSTTTVYFQWGTTTSYGHTTSTQIKTGNTSLPITANISGLSASHLYHFRIVATNSGGASFGSDRTFTTLSATGPPVVTTNPATNLTTSSARLNGSLDPHGLTTTVYFKWGTTIGYGHTTPAQTQTGNTYRNIIANISGLTTHHTYHFRIVATNSAGTRMGSDQTFNIP